MSYVCVVVPSRGRQPQAGAFPPRSLHTRTTGTTFLSDDLSPGIDAGNGHDYVGVVHRERQVRIALGLARVATAHLTGYVGQVRSEVPWSVRGLVNPASCSRAAGVFTENGRALLN